MGAIRDAARTDLHNRVRDVLGEQEGDTLMAHLPPVGWADVATKKDIEHLRLATKADMERGFRRQTMWIATLFAAQAAAQLAMVSWVAERLAG